MLIYNYSKDTKEYIGSSRADESPLEPGVFLIPAYATDIEPPEVMENTTFIFNDGLWEEVSDYRSQSVCLIDLGGYFVSPYFLEIGEIPDLTHILSPIPDPFMYKPKLLDGLWVVGDVNYLGTVGCIIDINGNYINTRKFSSGEEPTAIFIVSQPPDINIYKPKWNGTEWVQGEEKPQSIINEENNVVQRKYLSDTDWKVIRHRDQIDAGISTSLTAEEFQVLLLQRQVARDSVIAIIS